MDPHRISTAQQLREVVGEELPLTAAKVFPELEETAEAFIRASPFLILSTADAKGNIDVSPKGDPPGFVRIENSKTLLIPDRTGNKMALGHLNVLENPKVGLIFLLPGTPETLRLSGVAELSRDPSLLASMEVRGKPAVLAIRVHVEEVFFHCPKAFMRSKLWDSASWGERRRISMGKILARRLDKDTKFAQAIDDFTEQSRQELAKRI
ncbi:MAG: pyridoxamine 5'-phosphate oxidase family protein [Candidatus Binatia bacterium]|nr:pyridoxamine 5'-phosphate oxidase family protein [Candidatus Binatia bacterium]